VLNVTTIEQVCYMNRFSNVLFMTPSKDQEPGSQNGYRGSCTPKPIFTWEVDQEFFLRPLQTSWKILAGWSWYRDPGQERG